MSDLFKDLKNFDADVSSWDTSSVTNMYEMFRVRCLHRRRLPPPASQPAPRPALVSTLGSKRRRSTSR
eukprot:scaffold20948_cov51-Phaeocystis_antarctica.AAC.5